MAGLQAYLAFTETVKHGNFAAAGREMGMSASAVAKSIDRLEAHLGIRLFHRTTRQVAHQCPDPDWSSAGSPCAG